MSGEFSFTLPHLRKNEKSEKEESPIKTRGEYLFLSKKHPAKKPADDEPKKE